MRKLLLAGIAVAMMATPALAANYRFVIVPKAMNNPFFDFARDGCLKRAKERGHAAIRSIDASQALGVAVSVGALGVFSGAAILLAAVAWRTGVSLVASRAAA